MWEGGNVGHYAREQPRVLIDGDPRRAPWIDLGDLRSKGAVVLWTCSENAKNKCNIDTTVIPVPFRGIGWDAQVQPPFALPFRHGDMVLIVGWAILRPSSTSSMRYGKDLGHGKRRARRHADHGASVEPTAVSGSSACVIKVA